MDAVGIGNLVSGTNTGWRCSWSKPSKGGGYLEVFGYLVPKFLRHVGLEL